MSTQGNGTDLGTLVAGADLSAKQFYFVKVDSGGVLQVAAAGEPAIGVLQNKPTLGQSATVRIAGVSKVVAGGAVAAGALIESDSAGKSKTAIPAVTNTADAGGATDALLGGNVMGTALTAAAGAGIVHSVLIEKRGAVPTTVS